MFPNILITKSYAGSTNRHDNESQHQKSFNIFIHLEDELERIIKVITL